MVILMEIGVFATFMSLIETPEVIGDFAQRAEEAGLDALWMGKHVVLFDEMEFGYPGTADGKVPVPQAAVCWTRWAHSATSQRAQKRFA